MSKNPALLNNQVLEKLSKQVSVPTYDRQKLSAAIVHVGVGNFHRAHQAWYLDQLMESGVDHDWALIGAGVRPQDAFMAKKLSAQDWLTTVVELNSNGLSARVCGAMVGFVEAGSDELVKALCEPSIKIISLTITEGGYYTDNHTGRFLLEHPDIVHDINNPDKPNTIFGIITSALKIRRQRGVALFTVLSCDNLPNNGDVTKRAVVKFATEIDPELGRWVQKSVGFPNSVVDCITPETTQREIDLVETEFGIKDKVPVACEPFRQWIIEDHFPQGRPSLEKVGVKFVDDATPYELLKLRVLNGGHCALAFASVFLGHEYVHEAMDDARITAFLKKIIAEDIIPVLPAIPDVCFKEYSNKTLGRFSNSNICDTISRLCSDTSNRLPKFILPSVLDNLALGRQTSGLALVVALWCYYCELSNNVDSGIKLNDPQATLLMKKAVESKNTPLCFLQIESIFGSLSDNSSFALEFENALNDIRSKGVAYVIEQYIK